MIKDWKFSPSKPDTIFGHEVFTEDGDLVCKMPHYPSKKKQKEYEENGKLIASLPKMVRALIHVARLNSKAGEIGPGMLNTIIEEARSALSDAKINL